MREAGRKPSPQLLETLKMKKIIAIMAVVAAVGAVAPSAHAYTIVNGQRVVGYVRGYVPEESKWVPYVDTTNVPQGPSRVVGNTQVYDMADRLLSQDRLPFFMMVKRARILY